MTPRGALRRMPADVPLTRPSQQITPCGRAIRSPASCPRPCRRRRGPEPQASVQPRWPWPALMKRPLIAVGPRSGVPAGTDRPEARPDARLGAIEMARQFREGEAGIRDDRLGARHRRRRVVAGDLGRPRDAHAVADRNEAEELAVVDDRHARRRVPGAAREGDRDALHRIDRHADAELGEERRA